jgi:hypothetical protein
MAQHYPVNLKKEIEVRKSIERIGRYIARNSYLRLRYQFEKDCVYKKDIMSLPKDYYATEDAFVVTIGPYKLKRTKEWWKDYWENANLECHFDKEGKINAVYYPL